MIIQSEHYANNRLKEEDGKIYEVDVVNNRAIQMCIDQRKSQQESEAPGADNRLVASYLPEHFNQAIHASGVGHMPKNQEELARVMLWLRENHPYGTI